MVMEKTKLDKSPKCPKLRGNISILKYPCRAEAKLDGEWTLFVKSPEYPPYFINKYGTMRTGGLADEFYEYFEDFEHVMVMGELYHGDGKKGALFKLLSDKTDTSGDLNFTPFDIVGLNDDVYKSLPYEERLDILETYVYDWESYYEPVWCGSEAELILYYKAKTCQGYEGIVAKNTASTLNCDTVDWVKLKKKDTNKLMVLSIDPYKERIEVAHHTPDGIVKVGVKCCECDKEKLHRGDYVLIEHQGVLESGSLRHPVLKSIVRKEEG